MIGGLGQQGQRQSRDFAFHVCSICQTSIRMSYFVPLFFGYQLLQNVLKYADHMTWEVIIWNVLFISGNQFLLLATVLCHEFGHGNMSRYLGGDIDHILLWVFGGICFSSRPRTDDNRKILRNDLLVVAAGPATHFFQAPFWGLVLWILFTAFVGKELADLTGGMFYTSAWQAFIDALNPLRGLQLAQQWPGYFWSSLLWSLVGTGVQLNVFLFLFNVFFPMYPADGSKLLVTSLMFCCGLAPRRAANVLLGVSVPCALLMCVYSAYVVFHGLTSGQGASSMMVGLMGFMGVMSLMESWNIYNLKRQRQLHRHALFQTARSWNRSERDAFGAVHRINTSEYDDDTPLFTGGCSSVASGCSLFVCCPCFRQDQRYVGDGHITGVVETSTEHTGRADSLRGHRTGLLDKVESGQAARQQTVQQLQQTDHA